MKTRQVQKLNDQFVGEVVNGLLSGLLAMHLNTEGNKRFSIGAEHNYVLY